MSPKHDIITLDQIIKHLHAERFPDLREDQFFEIFVAEQILKDRDLSDDELLEGNPGGPHDGGIDAIHLFVNGVRIDETNVEDYLGLREGIKIDFHLIQAKSKARMEQAVIDKFSAMADDLFDITNEVNEVKHAYNSGVLQAFEHFRRLYSAFGYTAPEINIIFSYATRGGNVTRNMKRKAEQLCTKIGRYISGCTCEFHFLGATELLSKTRALPTRVFKLRIAEGPLSSDESGRSYVALICLNEYFNFITDEQGILQPRLFEANVRDWQGDNKVNVQIQDSLKNSGSNDFWWLNNGVTILAKSANQTGKFLYLENPEIVNGLQTSRAIFRHFSHQRKVIEDDRKLLGRIIVVADETENREQIIKATNSQTTVPVEALRSLDSIHRNIETYFTSQEPPLYYDRRRNFYKNRGKPAKSIIGIKKLAQAVIATALLKPDDARGRPADYLRSSDDEQYLSVFDENNHPALYYFCARFYIRIDDILKHEGIEDRFDRTQRRSVRFHIMTHAILRYLDIDRKRISSPVDWVAKQNVNAIDEALLISSANRVLALLSEARQNNERFKWSEFEDKFFEDLDSLLPENKSL